MKAIIFPALFFIAGLFVLESIYRDFQVRTDILRDPAVVIGRVVELKKIESEESTSAGYTLIVSYQSPNGRMQSFNPSQTFHRKNRFVVGDEIELLYERSNPNNIMVNNNHDKYYRFVSWGAMGFMFMASGIGMYFFAQKSD